MSNNTTADIIVPLVDSLIPLIITAIKAHMNATNGQFPTLEEVRAAIPMKDDLIQLVGQAFLGRPAAPTPEAGTQ